MSPDSCATHLAQPSSHVLLGLQRNLHRANKCEPACEHSCEYLYGPHSRDRKGRCCHHRADRSHSPGHNGVDHTLPAAFSFTTKLCVSKRVPVGVTEYFRGGSPADSCVFMPSPVVTESVAEVEAKEEDELGCTADAAADIGELEDRVVSSRAPNQKHGFLAAAHVRNIPLAKAAILFNSCINRYQIYWRAYVGLGMVYHTKSNVATAAGYSCVSVREDG